MVLAQKMPKYLKSLLVTLFGARQVSHGLEDQAEVVDVRGHGGVVGSECLLVDR
jgi:hypothetical protein